MSTPGVYHDECGGYHEYTGGYHEYTGGCSVHWGIIMSTPGDTKMHVGVIMSTPGGVQYTGGIPRMRKSHDQISRIFVLAPFATIQLYMLAFGTSDSLL